MTRSPGWYEREDVVLPTVLGEARKTYSEAIRRSLDAAGFTDLPARAIAVVGGIARNGSSIGELTHGLGMSKQQASQLIDTLVLRGYAERTVDPQDRRRLTITLTARGEAMAAASRAAVEAVDAALTARLGTGGVAGLRSSLGVLISIGEGEANPG